MMKSFWFLIFFSVLLLSNPQSSVASDSTSTHTSTLELKPASLSGSYKTAAVCFMGFGDCDPNIGFGKGDDYNINTENQCKNEGFIKINCNAVQQVDGVCPYNPNYGNGCKCRSGLVTCSGGQVGVGDECGGKYTSCQCKPSLISCASNQNGTGNSCGGKFEGCVCKPEYQYNSSNCSYPRSISGNSCGGNSTGCNCPAGVSAGTFGCKKYYGSPCSSVCQEAYSDNCSKRTSVPTPYGCMSYYADCSTACERAYPDNCRNRTAVSAPDGCKQYFADCASKCEIASEDTCESNLKKDFPTAIFAKTINDVSAYAMSGKEVVLMNNISDTSASLYIGNGTTIYSAKHTGREKCSATSLNVNVIQFAGASNINANITAKQFDFGGAAVSSNSTLTADVINFNTGTNTIAGSGANLVSLNNINAKSGSISFGSATTRAGKLTAKVLSLDARVSVLIAGDSDINDSVDLSSSSTLNINKGTHYLNKLAFKDGSGSAKTTFNATGATIYLNKGKQASSTPYYNAVVSGTSALGTSIEMKLSGTKLDMGSGELNYSEADKNYATFIIRLQSGSTVTNMGGIVCWGGQGLQFILDANSNSSIQMLGKTGTCSGAETVFTAKDKSKEAYVKLDFESKDVMVFACMFYQAGSGYDYLCERRATCNNVNGVVNTCEFTMTKLPEYTRCSETCTRNSTKYYGGKCTVDCYAQHAYQESDCYSRCSGGYDSSSCQQNCMYSVEMNYQNCLANNR